MSDSLPRGWVATTLGDLCREKVAQAPPAERPVPYIDISSIDRNTKRIGETKLVSASDAPTRARQWVRARDVLVSMTRPNLNAVAQVHEGLDGAVASTGFDVLRTVGVLPEWVFYRVRTNEFVADVCEDLQGVVYPAIRPHDVRRHRLPLPPAAEQHRIVSAIESYFTRLDDAVATLKRVQRNLNRYRASVLMAAVEGRLVPTEAELARAEGRDYEPAPVLLERILVERRRRWEEAELAKMKAKGKAPTDDRWKARYVEPVAPDTTALHGLPEGWCWASGDQLAEVITKGASPNWQGFDYCEDGVPFVRSQNVRWGQLELDDLARLPEAFNAKERKSVLRSGDVLLNIVGASIGRSAVATESLSGGNTNQAVAIVRTLPGVQPWYLCHYLLAPSSQRRIHETKVDVARANVSLADIARLTVPLPPNREQVRITAEVERILTIIEQTHGATEANSSRCRRLRQSILRWAFEGRLVDQDPTDEPAAALLERIRAERASASDKPPRRPRRTKARPPKS